PGRWRRRNGCDGRTILEDERRMDRVESARGDRLEKWKRRRRERRRDPGHFDPDEAVAGARDGLVRQAIQEPDARPEIVFLERSNRLRPRVFQLLRLQIENGGLPVDL